MISSGLSIISYFRVIFSFRMLKMRRISRSSRSKYFDSPEEDFSEVNPIRSEREEVDQRSRVNRIQRGFTATTELKENETYEVKYYWKYMFIALSVHFGHLILGPAVLLVFYKVYGSNLMKNMIFKPQKHYFVYEFLPWLLVAATIILISLHPTKANMIFPSLITVGMVLVLRNLIVSLKYGYYTQKHWNSINETEWTMKDLIEGLLLNVWIKVPEHIAESELSLSFKRRHIKSAKIIMKFKKISGICMNLIRKYMNELEVHREKKIPVGLVSKFLVRKIAYKVKTRETKLMTFCSVFYAFLPVILIIYRHNKDLLNLNIGLVIYIAVSAPHSYIFCKDFLLFILVGVYDFSRKKLLLAQCTALISRIDHVYLQMNHEFPRLDMSDSQTILAWYHMRTAFLDFGKRFTLRVFLYSSLALPVCTGVVIVMILMMFDVIDKSYSFFFVPALFLVVITMIVISYMVIAAVSLNKYFAIHRDILLSIASDLRHKGEKENKKAMKSIWIVYEKLSQDEVLYPVKIMGIKVDSSLYAKLGAIAISGIIAGLRVFYS